METIIHNNKYVIFTGTGLIFGHLEAVRSGGTTYLIKQIDRVEFLFEKTIADDVLDELK